MNQSYPGIIISGIDDGDDGANLSCLFNSDPDGIREEDR